MNLFLVLVLYGTIAALMGGYVFYREVLMGPTVKVFRPTDHAILTLTTVAVGALWVLFVPGLAILGAREVGRYAQARSQNFRVHRPAHARVRP